MAPSPHLAFRYLEDRLVCLGCRLWIRSLHCASPHRDTKRQATSPQEKGAQCIAN